MGLNLLGQRFEVRFRDAPLRVKAAIRARKKSMLEPRIGARGWIAGSLIVLWLRLSPHGPMLIGWVSSDGSITRIRGRAGSALRGLITCLLLTPFMIFLVAVLALENSAQALPSGALLLAIWVGAFWGNRGLHHEAEPLVRFLEGISEQGRRKPPAQSVGAANFDDSEVDAKLGLSVSGQRIAEEISVGRIRAEVDGLGSEDFLLLELGRQNYIQTASIDEGSFILERRNGRARDHFRGLRPRRDAQTNRYFSREEVLEVLLCYATNRADPAFVRWERGIALD